MLFCHFLLFFIHTYIRTLYLSIKYFMWLFQVVVTCFFFVFLISQTNPTSRRQCYYSLICSMVQISCIMCLYVYVTMYAVAQYHDYNQFQIMTCFQWLCLPPKCPNIRWQLTRHRLNELILECTKSGPKRGIIS